jgi:sulfatase modifying factor 1
MNKTILSSAILALLFSPALRADIGMQFVTVGDAGNPNDQDYGYGAGFGAVAATYAIGKYEVTLNQYKEFLNAVAVTDTHGLYSASMGTNSNSKGITRTGSPGSYAYSVIGDGNRPVTYVSWYDAARFSNWLSNGQPTGLQTVGTTESGSYTLTGNTGLISYNGTGLYRLPSESQWYKAAYYQPLAAGGDTDGYWLYPTKTNTVPVNNSPGAGTNRGNFIDVDYAVTQGGSYSGTQNYLTPVGAYTDSASYYGTFDQGGNVFEWNDAIIGSSRGVRGGSWHLTEGRLQASDRYGNDPTSVNSSVGFRVATVPEPTTAISLLLGIGLLASRRNRKPL